MENSSRPNQPKGHKVRIETSEQPSPLHGPKGTAPPKKGRPRDAQAERAILVAARHLALSTPRYRNFTMEKVAREAGVSKTTLYRRWNSKAELLREACFLTGVQEPSANNQSLVEDLVDLVLQQAALLKSNASIPVFAGVWADLVEQRSLGNNTNPEYSCPVMAKLQGILSGVFETARTRGDWEGPANLSAAYDSFFGVTFYIVIGQFKDISRARAINLATSIIASARTTPEETSGVQAPHEKHPS